MDIPTGVVAGPFLLEELDPDAFPGLGKVALARCTELLVGMSRTAINAGAEIDTIFVLNEKYFQEFSACTSPEDLGVWLSGAPSGYSSYVRATATQ